MLPTPQTALTQRVWDLPTRVFHLLLIFCVVNGWVSHLYFIEASAWHQFNGTLLLSLLLWRLIWGFVGSTTSRFSHFLHNPLKILRYLRGDTSIALPVGHNPLGGISVVVMLLLLLLQSSSGLFTTDDIFYTAPLNHWISSEIAATVTSLHKQIYWLLLAFIGLHLGAILVYTLRGKPLIKAMINGTMAITTPLPQPLHFSATWLALLIWLLIAAPLLYLLMW
ncbi:MAG: cytochrome b/b6 domain-containing protein [Gammaproteobacteria bacterium]|nr:cytochrome b/b6 domain-containing protein [Gammaproteobacteria bacterium]